MHIFFSGIGGTGIGPLALIASQAGFTVSGSDKQNSQYTDYLKTKGINLYIGQDEVNISNLHAKQPIDWYVYSSALPLENPNHPELAFVSNHAIKSTKRDGFLSEFIKLKGLKLIAFAGTHGKTSSTAMAIWAFKSLGIDVSYSVGAKISFGDMGHFSESSDFFVYECDEFDNNFLAYSPYIAVLSKVDWDHHEFFGTRDAYKDAFRQFCAQSDTVVAHPDEIDYLRLHGGSITTIDSAISQQVELAGQHNRNNAAGVITAINLATGADVTELTEALNAYPGSNRRFERIAKIFTPIMPIPPKKLPLHYKWQKSLTSTLLLFTNHLLTGASII
jgi:UDP-N-acetylmuramate--alanine ligase